MERDMMPVQPNDAEFNYEKDQTKKNYPEEWERYKVFKEEMRKHFASKKITGV